MRDFPASKIKDFIEEYGDHYKPGALRNYPKLIIT